MHSSVVIKFLNGTEKSGTLARAIHAESDHVELYRNKDSLAEIFHFDDIAFIKFTGKPDPTSSDGEDETFDEVTAANGERFRLRVRLDQDFTHGFYADPIDPDNNFKTIFFTNSALCQRQHSRPIGEVLQQHGFVVDVFRLLINSPQCFAITLRPQKLRLLLAFGAQDR